MNSHGYLIFITRLTRKESGVAVAVRTDTMNKCNVNDAAAKKHFVHMKLERDGQAKSIASGIATTTP